MNLSNLALHYPMSECIKRVSQCSNCGKKGHCYRQCKYPPSSYGVVNINVVDNAYVPIKTFLKQNFSQACDVKFQVVSRKYPDVKYLFTNKINCQSVKNNKVGIPGSTFTDRLKLDRFLYYKDKIMFMMVSRKFSLGFAEFMRGKYDVYNIGSIIHLVKQMYPKEIKLLEEKSYDDLLYLFMNVKKQSKTDFLSKVYEGTYSTEYCEAKVKYELLTTSKLVPLSLRFYLKYIKPKYTIPEWGFPKGRRSNKHESDLSCACREFEEETGYSNGEYHVLNKIEPFEEYMTGTNGVDYRHVYYVSVDNTDGALRDKYDTFEIGEIKWFTFADAIKAIRPYHTVKKQILTNIYLLILNSLINNMTI